MLKVAVVTNYFPISSNPWNGHSAYQTLRLLAKLCDVHVFYPEATYPSFMQPANGKGTFDRTWSPPDVRVTYIPYPAIPVLTRPFNAFTSASRLLPFIAAFQPDVILNYTIYPYGLAAVFIARKLGIPSMLTAIGSDLNRPSDRICAWLTRRALSTATFVVTVSHNLCQTAVRMGAPVKHTRAKLNGCDTSVFHPRDKRQCREQIGLDPDAQIILYVGRLDHRKGLIELVEAVARLHQTHPRAHCYLMGNGPDEPAVRQAIAAHRAEAFISIIPSRVTAEVAVWMAAADLVTLPSYMEGCPNVVIEALGVGRPIVATRVGGIPELTDDSCGRMVPPRDAPALAIALAEVLDQPWDTDLIAHQHQRSWADVARENLLILEFLVTRMDCPVPD
jgi:teichuronic acid biosynthesis glycosyltransferase TuaC